jgi:hypothetical protein
MSAPRRAGVSPESPGVYKTHRGKPGERYPRPENPVPGETGANRGKRNGVFYSGLLVAFPKDSHSSGPVRVGVGIRHAVVGSRCLPWRCLEIGPDRGDSPALLACLAGRKGAAKRPNSLAERLAESLCKPHRWRQLQRLSRCLTQSQKGAL